MAIPSITALPLSPVGSNQRGIRAFQHTPVRFGSAAGSKSTTLLTPADITQRALDFYQALKTAEQTPGSFSQAIETLLNGDTGLATQITKAIRGFQDKINQQRSCESVAGGAGVARGLKITSGSLEKVFVSRTNFFPSDKFAFDDFKKHKSVFGERGRVVVALTGWTKPPAHYLRQDPKLAEMMDQLPEAQRPAFAEKYYVELIKDYLEQVLNRLREAGCSSDDLAFLYGVTPQGVDRAVEEFCEKNRIRYAGVTCYDWVPYIDDVPGKRPIYLAKDPKEFGTLMSDCSDKVVVVGGRAFAATVTKSGEKVGRGPNPIVPIDLLEMQNIKVPAVVVSDLDRSSSEVENAAAVLKGSRDTNPACWPEIQEASNPHNDPFEVVVLTQVLKKAIKKMQLARSAQEQVQ